VRGVSLRSRAPAQLVLQLVPAILLATTAGCRHKSKTPEDAYQRFAAAVSVADGAALFDALDQQTRWDLMTIQKWHREAYDIVLSNYPEGPERDRETHRFERAATASSARELFKTVTAPRLIPMLLPLVLDTPSSFDRGPGDDHATALLPNTSRLLFARGDNGGWGFAGLAERATEDKNRAYHDLEAVRASAADYERAAARAAK
jgi:hypothetical protein